MNKSMVILSVYYGSLPWYFSYFVYTCGYNPSVDFYIVLDSDITCSLPKNVRIIKLGLEEFIHKASDKLGFDIAFSDPYKLNDFKPAFGLIFSELIEEYDFWGYSDIDIIWGDIRKFINNEILSENEVISVRHDFLSGYFTLYKNEDKLINLFKRSKDYRLILSSSQHYCFDETAFQWKKFTSKVPFYLIESETESMTHLVMKYQNEGLIKVHFRFLVIERIPGRLKWANGKLYYKSSKEVLLYHLIKFKKYCTANIPIEDVSESFKISPHKIY